MLHIHKNYTTNPKWQALNIRFTLKQRLQQMTMFMEKIGKNYISSKDTRDACGKMISKDHVWNN